MSRISETHCQRLLSRRSSPTARTTDDGGLAALAFNMIRSQSVAIVPCIVISGPNPMTATSTPTQYERSGWRPSLTMTRDRLEHPEGQRLLSEGDEVWERGRGRASARGWGTYGCVTPGSPFPGLECVRSARATKVSSWYRGRMRDCRTCTSLNEGRQTCQ